MQMLSPPRPTPFSRQGNRTPWSKNTPKMRPKTSLIQDSFITCLHWAFEKTHPFGGLLYPICTTLVPRELFLQEYPKSHRLRTPTAYSMPEAWQSKSVPSPQSVLQLCPSHRTPCCLPLRPAMTQALICPCLALNHLKCSPGFPRHLSAPISIKQKA